jgi:hypothetical protein
MNRFLTLAVLLSLVLAGSAVAADGVTRPDDRAIHGVGAFDSAEVKRPDDRAGRHGPVVVTATSSRDVVRPDDRAWRGVGPVPTIEVIESPAVSDDSFDWGDAGIGAAAAVGLGIFLAGASALMLRRRRVAAFS